MHPIRPGSCGWSYQDWQGVFYPAELPPAEFLYFYAERYGVVEVDSTFYRSPSPKTVEGWRDKTPSEPDGHGRAQPELYASRILC